MNYNDEDWSDSFDDFDTSFWENYLSGPDDNYYEGLNECDATLDDE